MKKWNVAIIGLGFVGKLHYDALRRLPNVHVRTIVVHKARPTPSMTRSTWRPSGRGSTCTRKSP